MRWNAELLQLEIVYITSSTMNLILLISYLIQFLLFVIGNQYLNLMKEEGKKKLKKKTN